MQWVAEQAKFRQVTEGKGKHIPVKVAGVLATRAGGDSIRPGTGRVVPIVQPQRLFSDETEIRIRIGKGDGDG